MSGFEVVARVDPIIPIYGKVKGQSDEEINHLVEKLHKIGVKLIVSKYLRLVPGIKKVYQIFHDNIKPYYMANRLIESSWELNAKTKEELLTSVYEACEKRGMKFSTCTDYRNVSFLNSISCDGSEELLKIF